MENSDEVEELVKILHICKNNKYCTEEISDILIKKGYSRNPRKKELKYTEVLKCLLDNSEKLNTNYECDLFKVANIICSTFGSSQTKEEFKAPIEFLNDDDFFETLKLYFPEGYTDEERTQCALRLVERVKLKCGSSPIRKELDLIDIKNEFMRLTQRIIFSSSESMVNSFIDYLYRSYSSPIRKDLKWPEKKSTDKSKMFFIEEEMMKANSWNACHDAFMKVINDNN